MTDVTPITPTLYIIMRSDIADMNPGKAMAQAAHAQADFDEWVQMLDAGVSPQYKEIISAILEWKDGRSFGRTLVLSGTQEQIKAFDAVGSFCGITVDPTYPWRNYYGEVFLSNEITCSWAFVCDLNPEDKEQLSVLSLHK